MKTFFKSRRFTLGLVVVGGIIVLLGVFRAGVAVGFHRALFASGFGDHFERNFLGPRGGAGFGRDGIGAHGVLGEIIKIGGSTLTVKGQDGLEHTVLVGNATAIREFRDTVALASLKVGDRLIIIGTPGAKGVIDAKLIRIMPDPNMSPFGTSTETR